MRNIYVGKSPMLQCIRDFLDFNRVPYQTIDYFGLDQMLAGFTVDQFPSGENNLLILDYASVPNLRFYRVREQLVDFCLRDGKIWFWNHCDGFNSAVRLLSIIKTLDPVVPLGSVSLFVDAEPMSPLIFSSLKNIQYKVFSFSYFYNYTHRVTKGNTTHFFSDYDFLMTVKPTDNRTHRKLLCEELISRPELLKKGKVSIRSSTDYQDNWMGHAPTSVTYPFLTGHPSHDLYLTTCVEIVAETLFDHGYYVTEKTLRPLIIKHPFLMASTPGFLKYLHRQGYKTFNEFVDEDYDSESDLATRMKMIIDRLQWIVNNDAKSFYQSCIPILEHNYNRYAELTAINTFEMDLFIKKNLEAVGAW